MKQDTVPGRRSRSRGGEDQGGRRRSRSASGQSGSGKGFLGLGGGLRGRRRAAAVDPDDDRDPTGRLPAMITLGALLCALWIFTRNTVPALQERTQLRQTEHLLYEQLQDERQKAAQGLAQLHDTGAEPGASTDPQALMVAIDALGLTPVELLRRYPSPPETAPPETDSENGRSAPR